MKHSPGNWSVKVNPRGQTFITADTLVLATTDCSFFFKEHRLVNDPETIAANAKLLAAAPKMAEALAECAQFLKFRHDCGSGYTDGLWERTKAALELAGIENA